MEENRIKRYKQKISVIEQRRQNIFSWISDSDEKSVLAIYKAFQEIIESLTDLCAMIVKDADGLVADDYSNIEQLGKQTIINQDQESLLKEANGLRNRLVHEYNGLNRNIALESIQQINENLDSIMKDLSIWIKKHSIK
ncbi:MAG: DUF86 domain-containing protein [Thermoplasmatota archaeon]